MQRQFVYHVPEYQLQPHEPNSTDRGYVLLSHKTLIAYPINEVTALVWEYCGRIHQVSELVLKLSEHFAKIPSLKQDVFEILGQFHDAGIIKFSKRDLSSDCAIVITVHNHIEKFGIPCLESVLEHSGNARVYLYDNESSDPKIEILRKLADSRPEVDFIRIDDQNTFGGLTGTWNDGIRRAREQGLGKVILLNHDVIVDNTWGYFIQAIESDLCIYGPLTNRPGGGRGPKPQMSNAAKFKGLQGTERLIGFCMGFTLGRPELKLFDSWRFFDPERPFGGNEYDIQKRMKKRSTKTAFCVVTNTWVFHNLNMGWKDNPRNPDPHDSKIKTGVPVVQLQNAETTPMNYVTRFNDDNIAHCLRCEILSLSKADPSALLKSDLYIVGDKIDTHKLQQKWRAFVLSSIFRQVVFIKEDEVERITNPTSLNTPSAYEYLDFIDYPPNAEYIRLSESIKENAGTRVPDQYYVLLNQRPKSNRYLMESNSSLSLEEYLHHALNKSGIPFISCDFSTMTPRDQAQLCRGAKIFISAHGAGISNIIFSPLHCHVLEYNFRKYWNCDPVCDQHFYGVLTDNEECDGELNYHPHFHKADFHNLCRLLDRPYTELEVVSYEGFHGRNPIGRHYMFVDGAGLLAEIEQIIQAWDSKEKAEFIFNPTDINRTYIHHQIKSIKLILKRVRKSLGNLKRNVRRRIQRKQ
ncbi:MAG: DUF563 domain-containing protein [Bacteroidetes bacterium]|nr:DUF563 domain-containing protein [Bacteroidota bacterium]